MKKSRKCNLKQKVCCFLLTFVEKRYLARNVHQLLFRTSFFVLTKFSMHNVSHMDPHIIYDLTVVYLFKCIFNLGPRATLIRHWPQSDKAHTELRYSFTNLCINLLAPPSVIRKYHP